jgi:two-component system, sensor histidine kinase and response regulator
MKVGEQLASINYALALDRVGGDESLLKELGELFLGECPDLVRELHRSVKDADADGIHKAAHTLKGSLGTLGAEEAMKTAFQMEVYGRHGDINGATRYLHTLIEALERVEADLREMTT